MTKDIIGYGNESEKKKIFDNVKFFRQEKEKIAQETESMRFDELKAHLKTKNQRIEAY